MSEQTPVDRERSSSKQRSSDHIVLSSRTFSQCRVSRGIMLLTGGSSVSYIHLSSRCRGIWSRVDGSLQRILEGAQSSLRSSITLWIGIGITAHFCTWPLTCAAPACGPARISSMSPICSWRCTITYCSSFKDGRTAGKSHSDHCRHGDSSMGVDIYWRRWFQYSYEHDQAPRILMFSETSDDRTQQMGFMILRSKILTG